MNIGKKEWAWLIVNAVAEIALVCLVWDRPPNRYCLIVGLLGLANLGATEAHRLKLKRTIAALSFRGPVR